MSQEWVSRTDHRWSMRCDTKGCKNRTEPTMERRPLEEFRAEGWYVAAVHGDACPTCVRAGKAKSVVPWLAGPQTRHRFYTVAELLVFLSHYPLGSPVVLAADHQGRSPAHPCSALDVALYHRGDLYPRWDPSAHAHEPPDGSVEVVVLLPGEPTGSNLLHLPEEPEHACSDPSSVPAT